MNLRAAPFPCAIFLVFLNSIGNAAGFPDEGRMIAERWCASCHQVSPQQATASADVPSFMTIAEELTSSDSLEALAGFLADPHPNMPDMSLTRNEIRNLVAYIGSLR